MFSVRHTCEQHIYIHDTCTKYSVKQNNNKTNNIRPRTESQCVFYLFRRLHPHILISPFFFFISFFVYLTLFPWAGVCVMGNRERVLTEYLERRTKRNVNILFFFFITEDWCHHEMSKSAAGLMYHESGICRSLFNHPTCSYVWLITRFCF